MDPGSGDGGTGDGGRSGFDDHTVPSIAHTAAFSAIAGRGPGLEAAKFTITEFANPATAAIRYFDANFYTLHDEWYWFRLLNGASIPGETVQPVQGLRLPTIAAVYAWARTQRRLPLDLAWTTDDRLYSPRYYTLSLEQHPKVFGSGSLVRVLPTATRPERWAIELEYTDDVTHAELVAFFQAVEATTPAELHAQLRWLVRSPHQEDLAREMERAGLKYADRILRYRDIVEPGQREVYASGLRAGRLRVLRAGESFEGGSNQDILVMENLPDFLPPAAGLITAVPQTPLAHVNVLARNRGIPNVFIAGVLEDPEIEQLSRVRAPVVVRADADGSFQLAPITETDYAAYLRLAEKQPLAVAPIDLNGVATAYALAPLSVEDTDRWRPVLGGKNTGMLALISTPGVTTVERPFAISVKPYLEHLAPLLPRIRELLANADFVSDLRFRFLALEGQSDYDAAFYAAPDVRYRDQMLSRYPAASPLGQLLRDKGLRGLIRAQPLSETTRQTVEALARASFGDLAVTQGLRFRSSSNVEDIEGFNGAGLYDSNTGYLTAAAQPDPDDQKQTLEWALKKTWASYWSAEAFEERRSERVDHLSGAMGVLVHPNFQDPKERANGVATFTIFPAGHRLAEELIVNVQWGAVSVTNPDPAQGALPEIDRLAMARGTETATLTRVRASNLATSTAWLLSDDELTRLYAEIQAISRAWLAREQAKRGPDRAPETLTLDLEFRAVFAGWPALASGPERPARVVLKQARSLEPGLRARAPRLASEPIRHDVLTRARRAVERTCRAGAVSAAVLELWTDPQLLPDVGFSETPFLARVKVETTGPVPELGWTEPVSLLLSHRALRVTRGAEGTLDLSLVTPERGLTGVRISASGAVTLLGGAGVEAQAAGACTEEVLLTTPREFLLQLLAKGS